MWIYESFDITDGSLFSDTFISEYDCGNGTSDGAFFHVYYSICKFGYYFIGGFTSNICCFIVPISFFIERDKKVPVSHLHTCDDRCFCGVQLFRL